MCQWCVLVPRMDWAPQALRKINTTWLRSGMMAVRSSWETWKSLRLRVTGISLSLRYSSSLSNALSLNWYVCTRWSSVLHCLPVFSLPEAYSKSPTISPVSFLDSRYHRNTVDQTISFLHMSACQLFPMVMSLFFPFTADNPRGDRLCPHCYEPLSRDSIRATPGHQRNKPLWKALCSLCLSQLSQGWLQWPAAAGSRKSDRY